MAKAKAKAEAIPEIGEDVTRQMLEELSHEGLVLYGRLNYGLDGLSTKGTTKAGLIDDLMQAARKFKGNAEMRVVKDNEDVAVPDNYVKIKVTPGDNNPNARPIPIGLNFRMATIPCNKEIIMHRKWLPCLEDAVQTKYFTDKTDPANPTLGSMQQHSYPFTILERGRVTEE